MLHAQRKNPVIPPEIYVSCLWFPRRASEREEGVAYGGGRRLEIDPYRQWLWLLGGQPRRAPSAGRAWPPRLPDPGIPGRTDDVDPGAAATARPPGRVCRRLPRRA